VTSYKEHLIEARALAQFQPLVPSLLFWVGSPFWSIFSSLCGRPHFVSNWSSTPTLLVLSSSHFLSSFPFSCSYGPSWHGHRNSFFGSSVQPCTTFGLLSSKRSVFFYGLHYALCSGFPTPSSALILNPVTLPPCSFPALSLVFVRALDHPHPRPVAVFHLPCLKARPSPISLSDGARFLVSVFPFSMLLSFRMDPP